MARQIYHHRAPIPGCQDTLPLDVAVLPPLCPRPKLPSDSELAHIQAQLDQFHEEEAAYVCLSAIETFEHPTSALLPARPVPSFDVASAESVLALAKSTNGINTPDPDNMILPMPFRPPERRQPFRVSSVIPKRLVIPEYSPPMRALNEKRAEECRARMLRLDALDLRQRQKRTRMLSRVDRLKIGERAAARGQYKPFNPWQVRRAQTEPPVSSDAANLLAEIDNHDRKMKALRSQKNVDSSLTTSVVPTGF
jgi:hypothetical protein